MNTFEWIDPISGEVREYSQQDVKNCEVFYKLGLVPDPYEKLDPTPLSVPFDCEIPLTRNQLLEKFGYRVKNDFNAYDDDDNDFDFEEEEMVSVDEVQDDDYTSAERHRKAVLDREARLLKLEAEEMRRQEELQKQESAPSQDDDVPPNN